MSDNHLEVFTWNESHSMFLVDTDFVYEPPASIPEGKSLIDVVADVYAIGHSDLQHSFLVRVNEHMQEYLVERKVVAAKAIG